ncbi:hypothetical protein CV83906_2p075 (plasmid) [Escherichia coli]|nr:hypothetical protein CV83906_2p075 [Escherichia coli]
MEIHPAAMVITATVRKSHPCQGLILGTNKKWVSIHLPRI